MRDHDDILHVKEVLAGNPAAFSTLVERHKNMVFNIVLKIVRSREDAEEIAQDAFLKTFRSLSSFHGDSKFSTWLYRIAYNAAISHTRRRRHEFAPIDDQIIANATRDEVVEDLEMLDPEERIRLVNEAVDRLPAEDSALVTLFYMEEQSIEDMSKITGLSAANVKVKLHRIRKRLHADLEQLMSAEIVA